MRSNHSTWDPRRPLYEELKAPPVPRRHYRGNDECYHSHPPGILKLTSILASNELRLTLERERERACVFKVLHIIRTNIGIRVLLRLN